MRTGKTYACPFAATAATVAVDFFEFTPADDKPIILDYIEISQTTEIGDAQEEMLQWSIQRGGTAMTSGSGGIAAANGVTTLPTGSTSGFTYEAMNTTRASFTAGTVLHRSAFNVRVGLLWVPPPEIRIEVSQANGGLIVGLESTPTDSITFVGTAYVEEFG